MDSRTVVDHLHAYEVCGGKVMPKGRSRYEGLFSKLLHPLDASI